MGATTSSIGDFKNKWCRIDASGPISMHTHYFQTEEHFDKLTVNGHEYSGKNGPPSPTIVNGPIKWIEVDQVNPSLGWKVCFGGSAPNGPSDPWNSTNSNGTSDPWNSTNSNGTSYPWNSTNSNGTSDPWNNGTGWTLQGNGCARVGHDCVMATTSSIGDFKNKWCRIDASGPISMHTHYFQTESGYDNLTVNGHIYSGKNGPPSPTIVNGPIKWIEVDQVNPSLGWKVCFGGSAPNGPSDPRNSTNSNGTSDPWNSTNSNGTSDPWN